MDSNMGAAAIKLQRILSITLFVWTKNFSKSRIYVVQSSWNVKCTTGWYLNVNLDSPAHGSSNVNLDSPAHGSSNVATSFSNRFHRFPMFAKPCHFQKSLENFISKIRSVCALCGFTGNIADLMLHAKSRIHAARFCNMQISVKKQRSQGG